MAHKTETHNGNKPDAWRDPFWQLEFVRAAVFEHVNPEAPKHFYREDLRGKTLTVSISPDGKLVTVESDLDDS